MKVQKKWFHLEEDGIKNWAAPHNDEEVICKACNSYVKITTKGLSALHQHSKTEKHVQNYKIKFGALQLHLQSSKDSEDKNEKNQTSHCGGPSKIVNVVKLISYNDAVTKAELIWILKCIKNNYSFASSDGIDKTFQTMFPDSSIAKEMTLSRTKVSYVISFALGPYFKQQMIDNIKSGFSLTYDETTGENSRKVLQTRVQFYNEQEYRVMSFHLETFYIGSATGEVIMEKLLAAIDNGNLQLAYLLMLGADGPNVNKTVFRLMNEKVKSVRGKGLVDIGSCNIHIAHNAFLKGLEKLGSDAADLVYLLHHFFDGWPLRLEDFTDIQEKEKIPKHRFLKHVSSRWLTLQPAAERILEQWPAIQKYFFTFVPQKRPELLTKSRTYKSIINLLNISTMKAELMFIASSAKIFTAFTLFFQKEDPLIHLVYFKLSEIVFKILNRICKPEKVVKYVSEIKVDKYFVSENLLTPEKISVSKEIENELLNNPKVREFEKVSFYKNAQNHYVAACKHLIKTSAMITKPVIKHLRCLHPEERLKSYSTKDLLYLAEILPVEVDTDVLTDEWKLHQHTKGPSGDFKKIRIDEYWNHFLKMTNEDNSIKFPNLSKVVKQALSLVHGSADIERGFSFCNDNLTEDRSQLAERTLSAVLTLKDVLRNYGNKPQEVTITEKLLAMARGANKAYKEHLEDERQKKLEQMELDKERTALKEKSLAKHEDLMTRKEQIKANERLLQATREEEKQKIEAAEKLLEVAKDRLEVGLKNKDLVQIELARGMLKSSKDILNEGIKKKQGGDDLEKKINKRANEMIENLLPDKKKKNSS